MEKEARVNSTGGNGGSQLLPENLSQVLSLLFTKQELDRETRHALRQTSCAIREAHDHFAAQKVCLGRSEYPAVSWELPSIEEVSATIRGAVDRGCRPCEVYIDLQQEHDAAASENVMVAFLTSLASAASVEFVFIGLHTPLTQAVARAISCVSPKLSRIEIRWSLSPEAPARPPVDAGSVSAAVQLVLQLAGPKLKDLSLHIFDGHLPVSTLESLMHCTALTKLECRFDWNGAEPAVGLAAESSMLQTLSSLVSLRDLSLYGGAPPPADAAVRQARAASLESCLSPLTALTRLDIGLRCLQHETHPVDIVREPDEEVPVDDQVSELQSEGRHGEAAQLLSAVEAEWRALAAAARHMPQLSVLRVPARANAADLADLTALTYLRVGALFLPTPPPKTPGVETQRVRRVHDLPPLLKRLVTYAPVPVTVAAMLRQSPAATSSGAPAISWEAPGIMCYDKQPHWQLEFQSGDVDAEGRLTAAAVVTAQKAVENLKGGFLPRPHARVRPFVPHITVNGVGDAWVLPPAHSPEFAVAVGAGAGTHCGSWLGALMTELRPVTLRLWGFNLSPRDMLGLARCGGRLEVLDISGCTHHVSSLPLLGCLGALEKLTLRSKYWLWQDGSDTPYEMAVVEAAFLALAAPAAVADGLADEGADGEALYDCKAAALPLPRLQRLTVLCDDDDDIEHFLRDGLAAATEELERRRLVPAKLIVERLS